ncbi:receptor-like protein 6 [Rutidosis leptorrhynchoides]|uniref:receptor-like protein 6 n=1 Tax=Rutidosis leptorrhynchoides TaxID=125765 RepID=UPI003A9A3FFA
MAPYLYQFSFIRMFFFFTYILAIFTRTKSLLSHDDECTALFQLKQSVLHQDSNFFNSWRKITNNKSDNDSDCCLWNGVVCSKNKGRHVIELDLSKTSLQGPISSNSTIFNLVYLQKLNLSLNDFSNSRIPTEIGHLKQLRTLDLSNSSFNGQIPGEISYLTQLSWLDLSLNPLQSPSLDRLLRNMTALEVLRLSGVEINSFIPRFLANFSSLTSILLNNCQLQDEFPSSIFHLPKLKILAIRNNSNLSGTFPEFQNNTLLEILDLGTTGFSGIIPEHSFSKLTNLAVLDLRYCNFVGPLPVTLSNLTQLTFLSLRYNEFTGRFPSLVSVLKLVNLDISSINFDQGSLPDWIGKLYELRTLYLEDVNLSSEIPPPFSNLTKLSITSLEGNSIYGRIPSSFMNLTQLTVISLDRNQLEGPISSAFSNFKNLTYLSLVNNNFSGTVFLDTFAGLNKLETLYLDYNNISFVDSNNYTSVVLPALKNLGLSFCNLNEFPTFLRFQNNMEVLLLKENKIAGLVPVWFWNNSLETLQFIELSLNSITGFEQHPVYLPWVNLGLFGIMYNQLQGQLPVPPPTIVYYYVNNNNLTGEIPSSICEARSLKLLDLSFNNMNGTLPSCLGSLSNSLSTLNLKGNNFHGTMMNEFTDGCLLSMIDLSANQFTGKLSRSLANCTGLEVLSLRDNLFDDVFPYWLGPLAELQVLILGSNKLHGAIQDSSTHDSQFSNLRIIDLSNNDFSGQLPQSYIKSWQAMKSVYVGNSSYIVLKSLTNGLSGTYHYSMTLTNKGVKTEYLKILNVFVAIDLSSNNFDGPIPVALQDLRGLQSLNLSNNHLSGPILPSLGNLANLESLDLSQNGLTGEIPQELLQLDFLALLNVSFNNLDGPIPQGKQFFTFQNNSYMNNPGLCGEPLSKGCGSSNAPTTSNTSEYASDRSFLPDDILNWMVIFSGVVSGFVVGLVLWNSRYARYRDWLIDRFGMREDKWVRPIRNTKRSN